MIRSSLLTLACLGLSTAAIVAGCAAERHAEIPVNAQMVAQGTHKITYTAPRDGMVWVYNKFNGNMEWAGGVRAGDTVLVDPEADKIKLNGMNVNDKPLTHDEKRIFFNPQSSMAADRQSPVYIDRRQVVDPVTGRVVEQSTVTREVRP
jgi:hypothetical protein